MSAEELRTRIDNSLDLLQMITEDVEEKFIRPKLGAGIMERGTMIASSLMVLSTYLRQISEEAGA